MIPSFSWTPQRVVRRLPLLLFAFALLFAACGRTSPERVDVPGERVRLWTLAEGRLLELDATSKTPSPLLEERFEAGLSDWGVAVDAQQPLLPNDGLLDARVVEGGVPHLNLTGRRGGLYRIVPVEPGTTYQVSTLVRTRDLQPVDPSGFLGGTLFVAQLARAGAPEDVLAEGLAPVLLDRHELDRTTGTTDGWVPRDLVLRTGPETRALLVVCLLGLPWEVTGGSADFREVTVREVDPVQLATFARRRASARRTLGVLPPDADGDWRDQTVVLARLRGEARQSIALLPGESLELLVDVPFGVPELELGVAPLPDLIETLPSDARGTLRCSVEGEVQAEIPVSGAARALDARWDDRSLDLSAHAGQRVSLTFAVQGDLPLVLGAPTLFDASRRAPGPNLVFFSIDTLRYDHLSCYGYGRETTPNLDALAARGLLALDCTAQAPYTLPSHVTLFSGQAPSVHGVQAAGTAISPARTPLLAEILAAEGLRTRAFTAGGYVNPVFGFDRGFDSYSNVDPYRDSASSYVADILASDPDSFDRALFEQYTPDTILDWIGRHADERWMLFLHTYTVHDFDPPPGWVDRYPLEQEPTQDSIQPFFGYEFALEHGIPPGDLENLNRHYDAALAYVDAEVGRLVARLEELGLADDTVIVVTSDHGKEIGERGIVGHGVTLYEELVRVPLIVYDPARASRVVHQPTMGLDVAPTALASLGLPADPRMQGLDLWGDVPARSVWSEVVQTLTHRYALREPDGRKLLHDPGEHDCLFPAPAPWELYDLASDPGERVDLAQAPDDPDSLERFRARLLQERARLEAAGATLGSTSSGTLDASTKEQLEALGYFGHDG